MSIVTVETAPEHIGERVTLRGWLYNRRSSGKILFLQLRDGTGVIQAVLSEADDAELFALAAELPRESSLVAHGTLKEDRRAPIGCELALEGLKVIHRAVQPFPIELKEQTPAFLMDHRHLWIRTGRQIPILRIRDTVFHAFREFFRGRGFVATEAPILTGTSVEGTTTLFEVDYYGDKAYLSQSGQLYLEATAMALGRVYWMGPAFRAEKSKTRNHVTEFWIAEAEMAFVEHEENLQIQEELLRHLVTAAIDERRVELEALDRDIELLQKQVAKPFPRVDYGEAVSWLAEQGHEIAFGDDLGAPQEEALGVRFGAPVFVERFPKSIKPFYMKRDPADEDRVLGADLIAPEGYGEIIGGSQREDSLEALVAHMEEQSLPLEPYEWYLDLRRYGSVPHSGFGMGMSRVLRYICGAPHIREVIPFARQLNRLYP